MTQQLPYAYLNISGERQLAQETRDRHKAVGELVVLAKAVQDVAERLAGATLAEAGSDEYAWHLQQTTEGTSFTGRIAFTGTERSLNVFRGKSGAIHLVDAQSRQLWLFTDQHRSGVTDDKLSTDQELRAALHTTEPVTFRLDTEGLRATSLVGQVEQDKSLVSYHELAWLAPHCVATTVAAPEQARIGIRAHHNFTNALQAKSPEAALTAAQLLADFNPQAETVTAINKTPEHFLVAIRHWTRETGPTAVDTDLLKQLIYTYGVALPVHKNSHIVIGDSWRALAAERQDHEAADLAAEEYASADKKSTRYDSRLADKLQKLGLVRAQLAPAAA